LALTMIAGLIMALTVMTIDKSLHLSDLGACIVLVGAGATSYLAACWLLDISHSRRRLNVCLSFFRTRFANIGAGSAG
jgi:hypothetical protein